MWCGNTVGGPDRPVPEKIAREKAQTATDDASDGGPYGPTAGLAAGAAAVQTSLYNKLSGVLGERGCVLSPTCPMRAFLLFFCRELLGDLEERIQSLGEGSRNMAAQVTSCFYGHSYDAKI